MEADAEGQFTRETRWKPEWRAIFERQFAGASTNLASDEGWHSVLGFDEEVIDGLWKKYGAFCIHGCSPLEPLCWMWLFSYLKSPTSWMFLSFMWRVPCTTFRTIVNEVIEQLQKTLNEVRTKHVGANKIGHFLTNAPYSRLTSMNVTKTYLRKAHFRTCHTSLIAWSSKSRDPIRRKRSWRFSATNPRCRHSNTKVRYANCFLCYFHQNTNILLRCPSVAVHITTGWFVHFAGPFHNTHDAKIFQNGFLPTAFDEESHKEVFPRRGLADRGYYSTNEDSKLHQCLMTVIKKPRDGVLSQEMVRMNQIISTLRIEVERALGRLKVLLRLVAGYRSGKRSLKEKLAAHAKLFKVCIHFTNFSLKYRPLRKAPHWLLCMGPMNPSRVHELVQSFLSSPPGTHISSLCSNKESRNIEPLLEWNEDEGIEGD